jgi:hypothetical protein
MCRKSRLVRCNKFLPRRDVVEKSYSVPSDQTPKVGRVAKSLKIFHRNLEGLGVCTSRR